MSFFVSSSPEHAAIFNILAPRGSAEAQRRPSTPSDSPPDLTKSSFTGSECGSSVEMEETITSNGYLTGLPVTTQ